MRKPLAVLAVLLLALALVGCSGSDDKGDKGEKGKDDSSATSTTAKGDTSTSSPSTASTALPADAIDAGTPYCAQWKVIRSGTAPLDSADHDKDVAARKAYYGALVPKVEKLASLADGDIKPVIVKAVDLTKQVAASGELTAFRTPEGTKVAQQMERYAQKHCS